MFDKDLVNKIDKFLHKNLDIVFKFEFNGLLLLGSNALKGFIMDKSITMYDFFVLTQTEDNILEFIKKYKLKYKINSDCVYTTEYNGLCIQLKSTNDLYKVCELNTDFLFYDVHRKQLLPFGIKLALEKRRVIEYRCFDCLSKEDKQVLLQKKKIAKEFIQFLNNDNKKVRVVRKKRGFWESFMRIVNKSKKTV